MNFDHFRRHLEWAEGRRKAPYYDNAKPPRLTIGVGRNLSDKGLRDDEIDLLMENDIAEVISECSSLPYWSKLNDARQLVVADLCFNIGMTRMLGFIKFNAALDADDFDDAAEELVRSKWYHQVGRRAVKLVTAMRLGVWQET